MDEIRTFNDLLSFIEINFESLTEMQYCELLREALDVYAIKPKDKETALTELKIYFKRFGKLDINEKPIFIHYQNEN